MGRRIANEGKGGLIVWPCPPWETNRAEQLGPPVCSLPSEARLVVLHAPPPPLPLPHTHTHSSCRDQQGHVNEMF